MKNRSVPTVWVLALCFCAAPASAQYVMERLGRGVVAVRTSSTQVYVGWRLHGNDPSGIGFNVYRTSGSTTVRLNTSPITATTNYVDTTANLGQANAYFVRPVVGGVEQAASASFTLPANAPTRQYLEVPLQLPAGGTVKRQQLHLQHRGRERRRRGRRRRVRIRRQVGPLEPEGQLAERLHGAGAARRLPAERPAPVAHRPRPQHPRRGALHAVPGVRLRRRRARRGRGEDRRRQRERNGPGHRQRERRPSELGRPRHHGARVPDRLRRADGRRPGHRELPARPRQRHRLGRQLRQPQRALPGRHGLSRRPAPEHRHGARLLRAVEDRGLGLPERRLVPALDVRQQRRRVFVGGPGRPLALGDRRGRQRRPGDRLRRDDDQLERHRPLHDELLRPWRRPARRRLRAQPSRQGDLDDPRADVGQRRPACATRAAARSS